MIEPKMGMNSTHTTTPAEVRQGRTSLADALFTGTQQRVLALLFGQPHRTFYANEIIALANSGTGAVQRELARLARSELVVVRLFGRQKHFQANPDSPIYAELCGIASKTMGLAEPLRAALEPLTNRIRGAFVYGSVAKRQDTASSDIDLMVLSDDVTYAELFTSLEVASRGLGRSVNPTIYTGIELAERVARGDSFVSRVMQQAKIWVIGDDRAFESR
jgi:predicted nucleotidyltransferase